MGPHRTFRAVVVTAFVSMAAMVAHATEDAALSTLLSGWSDGGSSSREARRLAIESLPLERLPTASRQAVEQTIRSTTLFRRLPAATLTCDAALLEFALLHPEAIVDVWRVLGISRLQLDPAGPAQWRLADGYGTVGVLRLVHHERQGRGGVLVFHGRGGYSGSLAPKPLSGGCVLLVRHEPAPQDAEGRDRQIVRIDAFLDVDGMGLELVTRTLQPLIVRSAGANFTEICTFMETLSAAAARNPAGVERLAQRLARTDPADRVRLAEIARAAGRGHGSEDAPELLQAELAARWLPSSDAEMRR